MELLNLIIHHFFSFVVIISVIVFIHEFGHYWVAKKCGVKIESFSIGFGKELCGWTDKHGTRWKIAPFPFGGYVKMLGDENAASVPDSDALANMTEEDRKRAFPNKKLWQRFLIVRAGPAANYILSAVIFAGFFGYYGKPSTMPIVGSVVAESPAAKAGFQEGDIITRINSDSIDSFRHIVSIVAIHPEVELDVSFTRDGEEHNVKITPEKKVQKDNFGNNIEIGLMGVRAAGKSQYEKVGYLTAVKLGINETYLMTKRTLEAIGQIITGKRSADQLSGALRIAEYAGKSVERGMETVFWFMAVLSLNLGLINLFPIPMLDGGHLFLYTIEGIRRKPLTEKIQEIMFRVGFTALIFLMVFAIYNDLKHFGIF